LDSPITQDQIDRLEEQGFPNGLALALAESVNSFPLRVWVVDNSGSMAASDGHRIVETSKKNDLKFVQCTRWKELTETVMYHARLAALLNAPTVFRMLNDIPVHMGPSQFGIADKGGAYVQQDLQVAMDVMSRASPAGVTPLSRHVREIRQDVAELAPKLVRRGQKVVVILATDGLPTDEAGNGDEFYKRDFVDALRSLEGLPVWIVVRLCTDSEEVVQYYNNLDKQLEFSVEVLDDFTQEANEVHARNGWLNYSLPLHRCREMGFHNRIMDLLDERALTLGELRDLCLLLFGHEHADGVPDPEADFKGFQKSIEGILEMSEAGRNQWDPLRKKVLPFVDLKKMKRSYFGSKWNVFS